MNSVLNSIEGHESFRSKPYIDPLAHEKIPEVDFAIIQKYWAFLTPTFGHGLTYITEQESSHIVQGRINSLKISLISEQPFIQSLPGAIKDVLVEMAFQIGVEGVMNFHNMIAALKMHDFATAAREGRDSLWWRKQSHRRAESLMQVFDKFAK